MSKSKKLDTDLVATELSESAFFSPQTGKTTSLQVGKTTKPQVEKYTTHLQPAMIKTIKQYALDHDMKDYEVVQAALEAFMAEKT